MEPLIFPHQIENIGPMTRYMKNLFPFAASKTTACIAGTSLFKGKPEAADARAVRGDFSQFLQRRARVSILCN